MVYAAASPAGAMLEILVHLEIDPEDFPSTLQLIRIELTEPVAIAAPPELPDDWVGQVELTRTLGDRFLQAQGALILPVPSAIIPCTTNYLFNPNHPAAATASIRTEKFPLDTRLV